MRVTAKFLIVLFVLCLVSSAAFALDPNNFKVSDADIYLPFEGADNGYDSEAWENKGTLVPGERPWDGLEFHRGDPNQGIPLITVTGPDGGIVGQAADTSHFTVAEPGNVHWWGAKGSTTTPLEEAVVGARAMTVTLWWRTTETNNNNMVMYSPPMLILDKDHWAKFLIGGQWENVGSDTYDAREEWVFCAVTIDTTTDVDNITYWGGSQSKPLTMYKTKSQNLLGLFSGDWYFGVGFGHPNGSVNNPFVGYIDEVRIYISHDNNDAVLREEHIQKIFESASINNCQAVQDAGYSLITDLDGDCFVTFDDFVLLAQDWLTCNEPEDINCIVNW